MDQINARLSQCSGSAQRDWMVPWFADGRPRGMTRRASRPTDSTHHVRPPSTLGLDTGLANQNAINPSPSTPQQLAQIPIDGVLPSPAPSDDTPQIISISSTRRPSLDRQQPRDHLDLDGMEAAIIAQHSYFQEYRNQRATPTHQTAISAAQSAMPPAQAIMPETSKTISSAQTVALPPQLTMSPTQTALPSTPTATWLAQTAVPSAHSITPSAHATASLAKKRLSESEIASQAKRHATDLGHWTPAQSASPRAPPLDSPTVNSKFNWQALLHLINVRQASVRSQDQEKNVLDNRFRLLREACELEDMAYLAVHQVYCVTDRMKLKNPASPPIPGIQILSQLLLKNDTFGKDSLEWFSTFPSSFPISPEAYYHEYHLVQNRLQHLDQNWGPFQEYFIARKSPPLDIDIIARLYISSPILQRIMHRCICRGIWPPFPPDNCLQSYFDLFTRYQADNRRLRTTLGITDTTRTRALESNYQLQMLEASERLRQHQSHATMEPRRSSSSMAAVSRTPVTLPATTVVPSNTPVSTTASGSMPMSFPPHVFSTSGQHLWHENQQARTNNQSSPGFTTVRSQAQSVQTSGVTSSLDSIVNPPRRGPGRPRLNATLQLASPRPVLVQPPRHNTLPSTSQPQSRFITQSIPLQQQQQQQQIRNSPRLQSQAVPISLFRNIDYSSTPLHPVTSTLHQAHLEESTINIASEEAGADGALSKYFHYLDSFALPPALILPKDRNRRLSFVMSTSSFNRLSKPSKAHDTTQLPLRPGSQTYRLRCVKVPNPSETLFDKAGSLWSTLETYWPEFIVVMLNDRNLEIRRKEVHGKDCYIEISDFIREGENKLYISLLRSLVNLAHDPYTYAFAIEVLEIKSIDTARQELGHLTEAITRDAITRRLKASDPDVEVLSGEPMRIPLIDPISLKLIASPVRGAMCKHFECFDLESFLSTRFDSMSPQCAKPETFRCPICQGDARPMVLLHDDWQMSVLRQYTDAERERAVTCVVVDDRGEWKFDVDKHDSGGKGTSKIKSEEGDEQGKGHEVIVLD